MATENGVNLGCYDSILDEASSIETAWFRIGMDLIDYECDAGLNICNINSDLCLCCTH